MNMFRFISRLPQPLKALYHPLHRRLHCRNHPDPAARPRCFTVDVGGHRHSGPAPGNLPGKQPKQSCRRTGWSPHRRETHGDRLLSVLYGEAGFRPGLRPHVHRCRGCLHRHQLHRRVKPQDGEQPAAGRGADSATERRPGKRHLSCTDHCLLTRQNVGAAALRANRINRKGFNSRAKTPGQKPF